MPKRSRKSRPVIVSEKKAEIQSPPPRHYGPPFWAVVVILAIAIGIVYVPALDAPFVFDDKLSIVGNETITSLWPLIGTKEHPGPLYSAARQLPTSSRPLVNLSFAINYAIGWLQPIGYHAVNVVFHFFSALLLWAITRRTLRLPYFAGRFDTSAGWLALAVAMLWALHPLQTETVVYTTQRTELMMAFFYLATLYCSQRYWALLPLPLREGRGEGAMSSRASWLTLAILACLSGMASKEVMVSAPVMVLLFERAFITGSLKMALRTSWPLYVGLAATWLLLVPLSFGDPFKDSAGFGLGVPAYVWWFTQCEVLLMYLKLVIWPWPLLLHYQLPYLESFAPASVFVVPVLVLGIVVAVLLWRNNPIGYLGTWVLAILSPTLVIPIVTEMAAERRMYLPLAALIVLFVVGAYWVLQAVLQQRRSRGRKQSVQTGAPSVLIAIPAILIALAYCVVSAKRVAAYDDEISLWQDVVRFQPKNFLARSNLGFMLTNARRVPEAIDVLREALALKPDYSNAHNSLGLALMNSGRLSESIDAFQDALKYDNDFAMAHNNLGIALAQSGRSAEAIVHLEQALRLDPDLAEVHNNLGIVLTIMGQATKAIPHHQMAIQKKPNNAEFHENFGNALRQAGEAQQAIEQYQIALRIEPNFVPALAGLARAFGLAKRPQEAIATAQQGMEIARRTGQVQAATQIEEWSKHYRSELERSGNSPRESP